MVRTNLHQSQTKTTMIDWFSDLFHHDHYMIGCTFAAFLCFVTAKYKEKPSLLIMFAEFLLCLLVYFVGMVWTKILYNVSGLFVYVAVQIIAIYAYRHIAKKGLKVRLIFPFLISLMAIYNVLMIAPYYKFTVFGYTGKEMHSIYVDLLGLIMLLQIFFMVIYNKFLTRMVMNARIYSLIIAFFDRIGRRRVFGNFASDEKSGRKTEERVDRCRV